jgi:hypothetical protein
MFENPVTLPLIMTNIKVPYTESRMNVVKQSWIILKLIEVTQRTGIEHAGCDMHHQSTWVTGSPGQIIASSFFRTPFWQSGVWRKFLYAQGVDDRIRFLNFGDGAHQILVAVFLENCSHRTSSICTNEKRAGGRMRPKLAQQEGSQPNLA